MKKGFKLTQAVEVTEALIEYRDTYNEKGKYLGFENLNDLYTMQLGTCTDWTGFPRSGKTQVLMELLLNTSLYYGWKHLVYFPDVGSNIEIIADLLHKKTPCKSCKTSPADREMACASSWNTFILLPSSRKLCSVTWSTLARF